MSFPREHNGQPLCAIDRVLAAGIAETLFRIAIYALDITAACDTEPRKEMGTPPPVANVRDALGCNARMYLHDALDHCIRIC